MGLGNTAHITDWITLVTSLLQQWYAWLKQDAIPKVLVNKSKMAILSYIIGKRHCPPQAKAHRFVCVSSRAMICGESCNNQSME
jgi:hypothetical protein